MQSLRKVAFWHFNMFLYGHVLHRIFILDLGEVHKTICLANVSTNSQMHNFDFAQIWTKYSPTTYEHPIIHNKNAKIPTTWSM